MNTKHSFSIKNPKDLLKNLEREAERFNEANSFRSNEHKYQYDHAINFTYTTYHMIDWLWRFYESSGEDVSKILGYDSYNDFHNGVRSESLALQICYEIANGSKHFLATKLKNPVVTETKERVFETDGLTSPIVKPIVSPVVTSVVKKHHADVVIQVEGKGSIKFTKVCDDALSYWQSFFNNKKL